MEALNLLLLQTHAQKWGGEWDKLHMRFVFMQFSEGFPFFLPYTLRLTKDNPRLFPLLLAFFSNSIYDVYGKGNNLILNNKEEVLDNCLSIYIYHT